MTASVLIFQGLTICFCWRTFRDLVEGWNLLGKDASGQWGTPAWAQYLVSERRRQWPSEFSRITVDAPGTGSRSSANEQAEWEHSWWVWPLLAVRGFPSSSPAGRGNRGSLLVVRFAEYVRHPWGNIKLEESWVEKYILWCCCWSDFPLQAGGGLLLTEEGEHTMPPASGLELERDGDASPRQKEVRAPVWGTQWNLTVGCWSSDGGKRQHKALLGPDLHPVRSVWLY